MGKRSLVSGIVLGLLFLLACCGGEADLASDNVIHLYYISNSETKVLMREYALNAAETEGQLEEIIGQLSMVPEKLEYIPPLSREVSLLGYEWKDRVLVLDMEEKYRELPPATEVLTRAALVRSFTQLQEILYVKITVDGEPLYDSLGNVVGLMSADQFIDNSGEEINTYEEVELRLYFANEEGNALVAAKRNLHYNTNVPAEKLVVEQVLAGVEATETDCFPTINPETKLLNVMVKDSICYVNLDKTFLVPIYDVTPEVTIYSLVYSLTELDNINKVQILVEGETNVLYRESIMLSTLFERNRKWKGDV